MKSAIRRKGKIIADREKRKIICLYVHGKRVLMGKCVQERGVL